MGADVAARPATFTLADRYVKREGTIYLSGIEALVRLLLDRARLDRESGLNTASYVTGYEGSPLGGYDLELAHCAALLAEYDIVHQPGLNEELAATAVSGTQLAGQVGDLRYDGVTGFWYGKAPGLDRATDAIRHANLIGTAPRGGAVAFVGDDPAAKSSSIPCTSEFALADLAIPTFYPADPGDVLLYGLHAVELSRASGLWSAIKIATNVADGTMTAPVVDGWRRPDLSFLDGFTPYAHTPSSRLLGRQLAALERSLHETRLPIAKAYIRASGVNRIVGPSAARIGLVSAGTTYLAMRQALTTLGIDDAALEARGIRLLKLGVVFPLEPTVVAEFAEGLDAIVIVEDKRGFIEDALKAVLYGRRDAPTVWGKYLSDGSVLFSPLGELDPDTIARGLARSLHALGVFGLSEPPRRREQLSLTTAPRMPFFCSGCPHNSSTKVAPHTLVGAGIGCHAMLLLMPGDQAGDITGLTQMGGEGGHWIGMSPFVTQCHFVQNIGDGTFAHSGSLAIRAAIASGVNVTFKLLRNSAVAMTGGQRPVGELGVSELIALLTAEGVAKVIVTTDQPKELRRQLPRGTDVRHRDELLAVQRELAAIPGVTVLIHDQECAAEKRRKRHRNKMATPRTRVMINERVCEGCGDCGTKSNCLSVQPVDTQFGRKTRINQSSCNYDFSCLAGDCPSFLTVTPGTPQKQTRPDVVLDSPPEPDWVVTPERFSIRIVGIGGTGVVTTSRVLATAAASEGLHVRGLDQTGLAQKGGAVVSDLKVSTVPAERAAKLAQDECTLYLGCDSLVATDPVNLRVVDSDRTIAVVSTSEVPTGEMVLDTGTHFPDHERIDSALDVAVRQAFFLDAGALARAVFHDEQYSNVIMIGAAYQIGALPISAEAIEHAITINGVAVDSNIAAFRQGRWAMDTRSASPADRHEPSNDVTDGSGSTANELEDLVAIRVADLTAYQNAAYAERYAAFVETVRVQEERSVGGTELAAAVARNLFKLLAYKDEYEVARLSLDPALLAQVEAQFGAGARFHYRLHPPVLRALGMRNKISLGPWFRPGFRVLRQMRRLRGTALDVFGYTEVRRVERALPDEYRSWVARVLLGLTPENHAIAVQIAELPDLVRGYEQIKMTSVETYRDRAEELLAEFAARDVDGARNPA